MTGTVYVQPVLLYVPSDRRTGLSTVQSLVDSQTDSDSPGQSDSQDRKG